MYTYISDQQHPVVFSLDCLKSHFPVSNWMVTTLGGTPHLRGPKCWVQKPEQKGFAVMISPLFYCWQRVFHYFLVYTQQRLKRTWQTWYISFFEDEGDLPDVYSTFFEDEGDLPYEFPWSGLLVSAIGLAFDFCGWHDGTIQGLEIQSGRFDFSHVPRTCDMIHGPSNSFLT